MLKTLHIRNYALIDSLDIDFPGGLVIITGQTGAGKSILLGALSLSLGGKADPSMIGEGGDNCVVEVSFHVEGDSVLEDLFKSSDLDWNGGDILIRRVLGKTGRARAFVNDEPVSLAVLSRMSSRLVDIHSQHQTLLLSDGRFQMSVLDHYAGNESTLADCASSYRRLQDMKAELSQVTSRLQRQALEKDYNQDAFDRLDRARLRDGELEELEEEHRKLSNAEEIKGNLYGALDALSPSDGELESLPTRLKEAEKLLERTSKYLGEAETLSSRLDSLRIELEDVMAELEDLSSSVDVSPERLEKVEDRMSQLYDLMKKHGCSTIGELIAVRDTLSEALFDSTELEERRSVLQKNMAEETKVLEGICSSLHASRAAALKSFSTAIQDSIRSLEMDRALFDVLLSPGNPSPTGSDQVMFRFSSTGRNLVDVAKCASGGEMSRIMLCLKAMMARYASMPSMIFDEIDTGVSGSVADKMGRMICSMGKDMQVFAITHLPQVAAKGRAHYLVSKENVEGRTVTTIRPLEGDERVEEIARMLSGEKITPEAEANARILLDG